MSRRAQDFVVWRAGNAVKWDCTAAEIGREVGLSTKVVQAICHRRGWTLHGREEKLAKGFGAWAADTLMRSKIGARHA